MKHVNRPVDVNECWEWTGYKTPTGYGWCSVNGKRDFTHRVAFRLWKGEIPSNMIIRHTCRNKCVNPAHLQIGTHLDNNTSDRLRDNTDVKGIRNPQSKLTDEDIREIRRRREVGEKLAAIAELFGVKENSVSRICARLTWKHVV
jgi:hypothetical protein